MPSTNLSQINQSNFYPLCLEKYPTNPESNVRPKLFMKWVKEGEGQNQRLVARWFTEETDTN
jgi:hypothetical protein